MITFQRYQGGLYLTPSGTADPASARIGFLFQDASRVDPTFELSQESWTDPAQQGYFAFFSPSSTRDWSTFGGTLRGLFTGSPPAQFGWFAESGADVAATAFINVASQGTPQPWVQTSINLQFASVALVLQANPFPPQAVISFDDPSNTFRIVNPNGTSLQLTTAAPNQPQQSFPSSSPYLALPMDDAPGTHGGSVNAAFALAAADLAAFEAGFMYFAPGTGVLQALRYPAFAAAAGAATPMGFSAWLDVINPLDDTRSYLQFTDPTLASYFTTTNGSAVTLATRNGADANTSRLVFANRPVRDPGDTGYYYLTPAGAYGLGVADGAPRANLLCGVTGTEFMNVGVDGGAPDTLVMVPGQPAFQKTTAGSATTPPEYLDGVGGKATTSWVQLLTSGGSYVSQPQESPLYNQAGTSTAMLGDAPPESGLSVYLLDFLPLATWQAPTSATALGAAPPTAAPPVPMAPYSGLQFGTPDQAGPFLAIEATALNPTRKNAFTHTQAAQTARVAKAAAEDSPVVQYAMTPQGLLAGLDASQVWQTTQIAISPTLDGKGTDVLQLTAMGDQVRQALQQNQIFLVVSTLDNPTPPPSQLFDFAGSDQTINIAGWPFSLSPAGTPAGDGTPPLLILKFYPGLSIAELVEDITLWSQPYIFNGSGFTPEQARSYIRTQIQQACESVYGPGNCPDGTPSGPPDTSSLYYNFYQTVTDPAFSGLLALNCNMQLNDLPTAIRAVTGGMTKVDAQGNTVSNIDAFRVHHVGVAINDTNPDSATPALAQSSIFGLVDYEKPAPPSGVRADGGAAVDYSFEVEYLRALFSNSALSEFSCKINLTINSLFGTPVTLDTQASTAPAVRRKALLGASAGNVVVVTGSYQAHSTSGDQGSSGQGVYSFVAEGNFAFTFGDNPYLDNITLTKLQFSFQQETPATSGAGSHTSTIQASFGIWGQMVFKKFDVLDIFSFRQLVFNDLGISVAFDLTTWDPPSTTPPSTTIPTLTFSPGNLRLDLAASTKRQGESSLLSLLPFKLSSFIYNEFPEQQTLEDLQYISLSSVPLASNLSLTDQFNYGLVFDLDLGSWGALAGPLQAFQFSFVIGWLTEQGPNGKIAFGIQLPEANGKLEITIQGVLVLEIQQFVLQYQTPDSGGPQMLVLALHNSFIQILGQRIPPGELFFDFALFAPVNDAARIGWITALNNGGGGEAGGDATPGLLLPRTRPAPVDPYPGGWPGGGSPVQTAAADQGGVAHLAPLATPVALAGPAEGSGSPVFQLNYVGLGQRVGPDPSNPPTDFASFLKYMQTDFWEAFSDGDYDKVYHPDGQWLALTQFQLLGVVDVGFVFYDVTPFYSLTLNVKDWFNFEITYTKISDSIGLFYANFALPEKLRTFQVGAASLTLPSVGVSVYTNGNWKLDVGFPNGDDWTRSFRVQAQAGPVPVTGAGGFYIAALSSATSPATFKGTYPSILAFGFAARLGVGKDFTCGPLKAGISVTFFGIIQGAAGYLSSGSTNIFQTPDALSLQGQFGIIGELYGSVDFVIIKASVNVRLQASIGIILIYERMIPNSGSILLYIEASVSVSVKVEIDLLFFSVTISFSFRASFRFEWQLMPAGSSSGLQLARESLHTRRLALLGDTVPVLPLCPGLSNNLGLWFLPEGTVVFPAPTGTGTPWLAVSLGIPYDNAPPASPTYGDLKPFEALTAQLVTWAVGHALKLPGDAYTVTLNEVNALDQTPEALVGWIDYPTLLNQLAVFNATTLITPSASASNPQTGYASIFPMPPFLQVATQGRMSGSTPDDLSYVFASKNGVDTGYIATVDAYFNQLFVNQERGGAGLLTATLDTAGTVPLIQEIFLNYFTGLIRGGLHAVVQVLQDAQATSGEIDQLLCQAVGSGQMKALAGQMSSSFRGGARLPYTPGLTVPGGTALTTTNPLFALLWQEFPVGSLGSSNQYSVALTNPDTTQGWLTSTATWTLTSAWLQPFATAQATDVQAPTAPAQLPFTDVGPQSFAFQNAVVWTQPGGVTATLFPFPSNLTQLQAADPADISVLVQYRPTGAPYLAGGTPVPAAAFAWATQLSLNATQIPGASGQPLADVFSLSGASQQDQTLIERILADPSGIAAIQVLYQTSAGSSGLSSGTVDPGDVFVLRTNTTTVSAPPAGPTLLAAEADAPPTTVPVGAALTDQTGFLQIVQQATVTNAPGYFLRYVDTAGKSLPADLFQGGPAPITLLVTYRTAAGGNTPASPAQVAPYYNAVVLSVLQPGMLYYAETTDPALSTQYATVAAGSIGMVLSQEESAALVQPHPRLKAMAGGLPERTRGFLRSELVEALVSAGVTAEAELRAALADAGAGASQLNALYSLVTYQVQATTGFILSNLSAPVQPQQPDGSSAATDGVTLSEDGGTSLFRVYAPLYNLAISNQGVTGRPPNRYAEIGQPVSVDFFQNDAFGNQMPWQLPFGATNLYFDAIVPVAEWQGVVTAYDFKTGSGPQAGTFTIYLEPSEAAFAGMNDTQAAASLQSYYTILDQLTGPGVSMAVETNLAVQADGSMVKVVLSAAQTGQVVAMVQAIVTYLQNYSSSPVFPSAKVSLTVSVSGPGTTPPVFELAVMLGVERDQSLISPLLISGGVVTFPAAQNRYSSIVPTVGASLPDASGSVSITDFAAAFVVAFPALVLSVGLGGATEAPHQRSSSRRQRAALRAAGLPGDDSGSGAAPTPQSLWAVQGTLLQVQVGQASASGPFYLSPTPLDNTLNSAMVPLPALPAALQPSNWPTQQLFTDIDLDRLNTTFFAAVDGFLSAASAAQAFEVANAAYTTVATGRRSLADLYSMHEIDWLFGAGAPFTGPGSQLATAKTAFGEQMRAALSTAYAVDTLVQFGVTWASALPGGLGDLYSLFGEVRPTGGAELPHGFTLTTSQVPVTQDGASVLTFLFGVADPQDTAGVSLDLELNITHLQHFLEPAGAVPADEARPSIWLQLVDPYPQGAPHVGPAGPVQIPIVFRQYPTPPTLISQQGLPGAGGTVSVPGTNPLSAAAAWHLVYRYQVQLTAHDQLASAVTYNTNLSASQGGGGGQDSLLGDPMVRYTLFESLARFSATFPVLSPVLTNLQDPNWAAAAGVFAGLVQDVVNNTTWTPLPTAALRSGLPNVTDSYTVTDLAQGSDRLITLTWTGQPSSFTGAMVSIEAISPETGQPYPNQITGTVPNGITDQYSPVPPLSDDWVIHRIEVDGLNVLAAENAVAGVQVTRNLITLQSGGASYQAQGEFVYRTPMVRATQPVTPFVDNPEPIDVATLPNQGISTGCPGTTTPPGIPGLCQRIYTMMYDLLADDPTLDALAGAHRLAGIEDAGAPRRVKVACGFQYPVASASGTTSANPVSPLVPVVLARSFVIDGTQPDQLNDFSGLFATAIATWAAGNAVTLGPAAQQGAQFVFDITLYAQISGLNTPVLRLRTLQLSLSDIKV